MAGFINSPAKIRRQAQGANLLKVLDWLLLGGVIVVAATSPYFLPNLIKAYFRARRKGYHPRFEHTFYYAYRCGYIRISETHSKNRFAAALTPKGRKRRQELLARQLVIPKPRRWDRRWRVVIFDIPKHRKVARDALRQKLKQLGFTRIQKSVWLHPFPCEKEISLLKEILFLSRREVQLITASHIEGEDYLKKKFHL